MNTLINASSPASCKASTECAPTTRSRGVPRGVYCDLRTYSVVSVSARFDSTARPAGGASSTLSPPAVTGGQPCPRTPSLASLRAERLGTGGGGGRLRAGPLKPADGLAPDHLAPDHLAHISPPLNTSHPRSSHLAPRSSRPRASRPRSA
jgi:hypothetical protein